MATSRNEIGSHTAPSASADRRPSVVAGSVRRDRLASQGRGLAVESPSRPRATSVPPRFFYFDLGKVLVDFDVERMCRQMAEVAGLDHRRVWRVLYDDQLERQRELGRLTGREFYESFCQKTGTRPDYHALELAGSHIFELNTPILPLVAQLQQAGYRLGVLSNTCRSHWEHCIRRFRILVEAFGVHTLSFEVHAGKPEAAIYRAAAAAAGAAPEEIFFVDDMPDNVTGAAAAGFDAVQYTTAGELAAELRRRAVRFNY